MIHPLPWVGFGTNGAIITIAADTLCGGIWDQWSDHQTAYALLWWRRDAEDLG